MSRTVTTVSGKEALRSDCRLIAGNFYKMGEDCLKMSDNRWHRIGNGKMEFDYEKKTYLLKSEANLLPGVVLNDEGKIVEGFFSENISKNVKSPSQLFISEEVALKAGLVEVISTDKFYDRAQISIKKATTKGISSGYSQIRLNYNADRSIGLFSEYYNKFFKPDAAHAALGKELRDATFGIEHETSNGRIPYRHLVRTGLIPLRDGSLRHDGIEPFEYTTIPLAGGSGVSAVVEHANLLKKYTTTGHQCALHVHIGNYTPSKEYMVALYRVLSKIENEIYSMFPTNYKYTSENGFKSKDYCVPMPALNVTKANSINKNFATIYNYYAQGAEPFEGFGVKNHPSDRNADRKWNVSVRYHWANIVNVVWGGSGTVEYRLHPPTQNKDKIMNWLFICNAITQYAHRYRTSIASFNRNISSLTLDDILRSSYSHDTANTLSLYAEGRKKSMLRMDDIGDLELQSDLVKVTNSILNG